MRRTKQNSPHARILGQCQKIEIRSDKNKVETLTPFEHFVGLGVCRLLSSENHVLLYSRLETWSASVLKLIRSCRGFVLRRVNVRCPSSGFSCDPTMLSCAADCRRFDQHWQQTIFSLFHKVWHTSVPRRPGKFGGNHCDTDALKPSPQSEMMITPVRVVGRDAQQSDTTPGSQMP